MKKLPLSTAMLGLTMLLTACPGPTPPNPPVSTYALTVNLTGVSSAPVKVTNTSTNAVLNDGALASGKAFGDLSAGTVLKIEPGAVNGFTAPSAQTVTLDASKTVTLEYKATALPGNAVKNDSIQGKVTGVPYAGKVVLSNGSFVDNKIVGTLSAAGDLSLPLNTVPDQLDAFLPPNSAGCAFTGTASANPQVALFGAMEIRNAQDDAFAEVREVVVVGASAGSSVMRIYSAAAATIKGTLECGVTVSFDLTLQAGWNAVAIPAAPSSLTITNLPADARTELRAQLYKPSVDVVLPAAGLTFTSDAPVTVPATFYQDGAFSGQVSLSTNIPGLTVEPATLNLSPLSVQGLNTPAADYLRRLGLSGQRVNTDLTFRSTGNNYDGPFTLIVKDSAGVEVGRAISTLKVQRTGIQVNASGYNLILPAGKSLNVDVTANSVGGFSGDVTFSATDLPAGVTVTPVTKTLSGSVYVALPLQASTSVVPGTYKITLTANGAGRTASTKVDLVIPKPTVNIAASSNVAVYQNGAGNISVDVTSVNGFSGATTVSLVDLPTGVTATAKSVNVTPGATTTVQIPVQVGADAPLGTTTVKVTSPDIATGYQSNAVQLSVRPARTALVGSISSGTVRGTDGIWAVSGGSYDTATSSYLSTLTRFTVAGAATNASVTGSSPRLIATGGGVIVRGSSSTAAQLINDAGAKTTLSVMPESTVATSAQTDSQGRVWMIKRVVSGMGGYTDTLATWTPTTGTVQEVNVTATYGYSGGQFIFSPDGKKALYLSDSSGDVLKIDTVALTASKLDLVKGASGAAIADDGAVWFSTYSQLARINADDTVTKFNVSAGRLAGFDLKDPKVLWGVEFNTVYRIDATNGTAKPISMGNVTSAFPTQSGGLSVVTNEYNMSAATTYYLSLVK